MEINMRLMFCALILSSFLSACSTATNGVGEIVHHVVSCTEPDACKAEMVKNCPEGGSLHGIKPSITVEYSCE